MASKTWRYFCRVQDYVFTKLRGSTLSKLPSPFFGDPSKLVGNYSLPLRSLNIPATAFTSPKAPPKVYINEEIQDIIWVVMKAKPTAAKNLYDYLFKTYFLNFYKNYTTWSITTSVSNIRTILP